MSLNEAYEQLIEVENFVKNFKDEADFLDWLRSGTIEDLKCCLRVFEKSEMYWHCIRIRDIINEKSQKAFNSPGSST